MYIIIKIYVFKCIKKNSVSESLLALIATERAVVFIFSESTILLFVEHWQWTCALAHARLSNKSLYRNAGLT